MEIKRYEDLINERKTYESTVIESVYHTFARQIGRHETLYYSFNDHDEDRFDAEEVAEYFRSLGFPVSREWDSNLFCHCLEYNSNYEEADEY